MRKHGTLTNWKDDRGFGFITPAGGASDIFVHISAFPHDGRRPQLNELISFEVEAGSDGRARAVRVMRPAQARQRPVMEARPPRSSWAAGIIGVLVVGVAVVYGYMHFVQRSPSVREFAQIRSGRASEPSSYTCDGRTMCSQMTSCAEATYYIRHCPNTQMDGDNDGIPCEQQWCGQ